MPINRPACVTARDAGLRPDEPVIGIVVGGKARAYRLEAMARRSQHLINDEVGGSPVSVSYCDLNECVRVYAGPPGSDSLNLKVAGLLDGEMILDVGGSPYFQHSGRRVEPDLLESSHDPVAVSYAHRVRESPRSGRGLGQIPYASLTPVLTTWRAWIERYPQSDVYTGMRPASDPESRNTRDR